MSMSCGLAVTGKVPYASTFAIFAAGRAYDQVRLGAELEQLGVHTQVITPHLPDKYKSSLLHGHHPLP